MEKKYQFSGWTINNGDYVRYEDDYAKRHRRYLTGQRIEKITGIVFFSAISLFLLLAIIYIASGI